MRLDRAVAERALARSRSHAQQLIQAGDVTVNGVVETRPSRPVDAHDVVDVVADSARYVSRAAHKLAGALDACVPLGLVIEGRRVLDAGASTGGFTQVALDYGAASVLALDVGHDQMDPRIARDPRVTRRDGVNVRDLTSQSPGAGVDVVVADLSFISLTTVMAALVAFGGPSADYLLMVKPQFEAGREALNKKGIVESPDHHVRSLVQVCTAMTRHGLGIMHMARSVLPGGDGNVEFFVWGVKAWQARSTGPAPLPFEQIDDAAVAVVKGAR